MFCLIETSGAVGLRTHAFLCYLGRSVSLHSGEAKSASYLFQRISVALQRGNAVSVLGCARPFFYLFLPFLFWHYVLTIHRLTAYDYNYDVFFISIPILDYKNKLLSFHWLLWTWRRDTVIREYFVLQNISYNLICMKLFYARIIRITNYCSWYRMFTSRSRRVSEMATICHYFKPKDSFPDPSWSLSRTIPPSALAQANIEVRAVAQSVARTEDLTKS